MNSPITARTAGCGPGCGGSSRSARPRRGCRPHVVHLGDVEFETAALAAPLVEPRGADAALLLAQLLVQLHQVGGDGGGGLRPLGADRVRLGPDLLERGVAAGRRLRRLGLQVLQCGGQFLRAGLGGLVALHDLQNDRLQIVLAPGQRGDLALEALQILGAGHLARVQALLVAGGALPDLVDVLLGLGLFPCGVALLGPCGDQQVALLGQFGVQRTDFGVLRQRVTPVRELGQPDVEGLDVEQADLIGGGGVQLGAPSLARGAVWWVVHGSVTRWDTWVRRPQPFRSETASSWAAACSHQGHSVAQWAASTRASGECSRASEAGWCRRSAVR